MIARLLAGLLSTFCFSVAMAQQPPGKTGATTPQPPVKTTTPPAKTTMPPDKAMQPTSAANTERLVATTFDGVQIDGDYYPAAEGKMKTSPCLILLHAVGSKHLTSSRQDFGKLPERLQSLGYAVAVIDLRGYGKSKVVSARFWNFHRTPRSGNTNTIEAKDFSTSVDMLEMLYDITAVKLWLNNKNNAKECNSRAIGVIGVEQSGLLALAWAANESLDTQRIKNPNQNNNNNNNFNNNNQGNFGNTTTTIPHFEGEDILCVVPISTTNKLNDGLKYSDIENWITYIRDRGIATMSIYGAQDKEAIAFWNKAVYWAKPAGDKYNRYKFSGVKQVKGTSLAGAKLLSNETLEVGKMLEDYLEDALKKPSQGRLWANQPGSDSPTPIDFTRIFVR